MGEKIFIYFYVPVCVRETGKKLLTFLRNQCTIHQAVNKIEQRSVFSPHKC